MTNLLDKPWLCQEKRACLAALESVDCRCICRSQQDCVSLHSFQYHRWYPRERMYPLWVSQVISKWNCQAVTWLLAGSFRIREVIPSISLCPSIHLPNKSVSQSLLKRKLYKINKNTNRHLFCGCVDLRGVMSEGKGQDLVLDRAEVVEKHIFFSFGQVCLYCTGMHDVCPVVPPKRIISFAMSKVNSFLRSKDLSSSLCQVTQRTKC